MLAQTSTSISVTGAKFGSQPENLKNNKTEAPPLFFLMRSVAVLLHFSSSWSNKMGRIIYQNARIDEHLNFCNQSKGWVSTEKQPKQKQCFFFSYCTIFLCFSSSCSSCWLDLLWIGVCVPFFFFFFFFFLFQFFLLFTWDITPDNPSLLYLLNPTISLL